MHEPTFRKACADAGLNPYLCQMANIREHCSWVTEDPVAATAKTKRIISAQIHRLPLERTAQPHRGPGQPRRHGGRRRYRRHRGGAQARRRPARRSISSRRTLRSAATWRCSTRPSRRSTAPPASSPPRCRRSAKTPTSRCWPSLRSPRSTATWATSRSRSRRRRATSTSTSAPAAAPVQEVCVVRKVKSEFDVGLGYRSAIYIPFPQAVPLRATIDPDKCLTLPRASAPSSPAYRACGPEAIDFTQQDEYLDIEVGRHHHGHRVPALGRHRRTALRLRPPRQRHLQPRVRAPLQRLGPDRRSHHLQERRGAQVGRHPALCRQSRRELPGVLLAASAACTR